MLFMMKYKTIFNMCKLLSWESVQLDENFQRSLNMIKLKGDKSFDRENS